LSPLENLLASIEAEAKQENERLEAKSRAEAEEILARAREEAQAVREEVLPPREAEARAEAERRTARARLEAAKVVQAAREEALERLLDEVRSRLAARRDTPGYRAAFRTLLREGLAALPDARVLRVDPRDEELATELAREAGADLAVETSPGETLGGPVLESGDGRVVRNTFEERLANAEPRLRLWYARRLAELAGEEH
jgi:vacuolar-type H+-ATPase subunit E/Vma4